MYFNYFQISILRVNNNIEYKTIYLYWLSVSQVEDVHWRKSAKLVKKDRRYWGGLHVSMVLGEHFKVCHGAISVHISSISYNLLINALSHQLMVLEWVTGHSGRRRVQDKSTFLWRWLSGR